MDRDSSAGKLDFLFEEAESESAEGLLREAPEAGENVLDAPGEAVRDRNDDELAPKTAMIMMLGDPVSRGP
jgi:hypothetical protein